MTELFPMIAVIQPDLGDADIPIHQGRQGRRNCTSFLSVEWIGRRCISLTPCHVLSPANDSSRAPTLQASRDSSRLMPVPILPLLPFPKLLRPPRLRET